VVDVDLKENMFIVHFIVDMFAQNVNIYYSQIGYDYYTRRNNKNETEKIN